MPKKKLRPVEPDEIIDRSLIPTSPLDKGPDTYITADPGDSFEYLEHKALDYIKELELIGLDRANEIKDRTAALRILVNLTPVGRAKAPKWSQNNVKQEIHLHGGQNLPQFNELPTSKIRDLIGQIERTVNGDQP